MVYSAAIEKMLGLGFQYLVLHFKGTTPSKRHILKAFSEYFTIILFVDHTSVMHNGCRPRKMRRV
jgi:ribosomal protein S11